MESARVKSLKQHIDECKSILAENNPQKATTKIPPPHLVIPPHYLVLTPHYLVIPLPTLVILSVAKYLKNNIEIFRILRMLKMTKI